MTHAQTRYHHRQREKRGLLHNLRLALTIGAILVILVWLEGCSGGQGSFHPASAASTPTPTAAAPDNMSGPEKSTLHNPTVAILGDAQVAAWGTVIPPPPLWKFYGTPQSTSPPPTPPENSGQILARLDQIIGPGLIPPDVLVIYAGPVDMQDPRWTPPCSGIFNEISITIETCDAIQLMTSQAHAAGVKVVVCTVLGTSTLAADPTQVAENESEFDRSLLETLGLGTPPNQFSEDAIADVEGAAREAVPVWSSDGQVPDAAGARIFTAVVQKVVASLHVGGAR
jgi:hypothetical protein